MQLNKIYINEVYLYKENKRKHGFERQYDSGNVKRTEVYDSGADCQRYVELWIQI